MRGLRALAFTLSLWCAGTTAHMASPSGKLNASIDATIFNLLNAAPGIRASPLALLPPSPASVADLAIRSWYLSRQDCSRRRIKTWIRDFGKPCWWCNHAPWNFGWRGIDFNFQDTLNRDGHQPVGCGSKREQVGLQGALDPFHSRSLTLRRCVIPKEYHFFLLRVYIMDYRTTECFLCHGWLFLRSPVISPFPSSGTTGSIVIRFAPSGALKPKEPSANVRPILHLVNVAW